MKYFLIAGEASGDLHASALMRELKLVDTEAEFRFFGGDYMKSVGGKLIKHIREMAFMGFWSVFRNAGKIFKNFRVCKQAIKDFQPDVVIMIDYPGFNLRMAKYIRKNFGIPVYYYISPSVWAWKSYRVKQIKRDVTQMLTIIPFETKFYASYGYQVNYVGNPTIDAIHEYLDKSEHADYFKKKYFLSSKPIIALLPGSRNQEIAACLPKMIAAAKQFPEYQIVISGAPGKHIGYYHEFYEDQTYPVVMQNAYQLLYHADIAIVNSGTATLETALIGTPQIVVYHVMFGRLGYLAKEIFIKLKYISLVNILAGKQVVKEYIAHLFTTENIVAEMKRILQDQVYRDEMIASYNELRKSLGDPGTAKRAAEFIFNHQRSK
ncbi:MAG: lipid-A-disaccharide synthase [Paludibacter sp.]|nr:lipid-A-disaccharide synthase [Paludibacter sp.]